MDLIQGDFFKDFRIIILVMEMFSGLRVVSMKHSFAEFQKLFVVFWVFSFLGHYLEIIWALLNFIVFGSQLWIPTTPTILPLAPPYGLGIIAVIIFTYPLIKRHDFGPIEVFVLNVFICGVVEYLCASFLVQVVGYNQFWDYSNQPFNINGYICLTNSLIFGFCVTIFIYYIYPFCHKAMNKLKIAQINNLFWLFFIAYGIDLIFMNFR